MARSTSPAAGPKPAFWKKRVAVSSVHVTMSNLPEPASKQKRPATPAGLRVPLAIDLLGVSMRLRSDSRRDLRHWRRKMRNARTTIDCPEPVRGGPGSGRYRPAAADHREGPESCRGHERSFLDAGEHYPENCVSSDWQGGVRCTASSGDGALAARCSHVPAPTTTNDAQ